jgi:hypothetical protein
VGEVDIPYKPAVELALGSAIWALGHMLWGISFTRQWYADILKDRGHVLALIDTAKQKAPVAKLMADIGRRTRSRAVVEDNPDTFPSKIEASVKNARDKWEHRWQRLFAVTFLMVLCSAALSPYVLLLNLIVVFVASRYVGSFRDVFSDALIALLPTVELIIGWFEKDPDQCVNWCAEWHPEFQVILAALGSTAHLEI